MKYDLAPEARAMVDALRQPKEEPMDINDLPSAKPRVRQPKQKVPPKAPEFLPTPRKMNDEETM